MAKRKTTVYLDEHLLREVQVLAARTNKPVSEVFDDALREYLGHNLFASMRMDLGLDEDALMEMIVREQHDR